MRVGKLRKAKERELKGERKEMERDRRVREGEKVNPFQAKNSDYGLAIITVDVTVAVAQFSSSRQALDFLLFRRLQINSSLTSL